ncbi:tRNA threonylcarbamoyladenosine biosynthesis protein TsaB [Pseudobythopirellula maris]|uniref:N(6)-L-threonylcarbamoyladenine synthase n=1 Tax=Pseudobythopirellula maris TaxID=2527991 RepID=A0A5C5ZTX3_9BACT|nr:tRNA (adenosine(37)-N6)-threonylcarbamoyltransferase complex dimerization subunit type 1 TsaB [Pseudobythopirellula maris]TWT90710.1 tRNA threonylcarbamoyladenosine biosynthesis protein TsaB [Pseudobythopirellula maris]
MTLLLAIESSGRNASMALFETVDEGPGGPFEHAPRLVQSVLPTPGQRGAVALAPAIDRLLSLAGASPNQIGLVAVTTGPGSFTGLRVGVATAKAFAYAVGAKVVAINTLDAIALRRADLGRPVVALLDAQRGELFAARYEAVEPLGDAATRILGPEGLEEMVQAGDLLTGPGVAKLTGALPVGAEAADKERWAPRAEEVGRVAAALAARGETLNPFELTPNYFRRSAAEDNWAKQRS